MKCVKWGDRLKLEEFALHTTCIGSAPKVSHLVLVEAHSPADARPKPATPQGPIPWLCLRYLALPYVMLGA
jgi:hypothetical protein